MNSPRFLEEVAHLFARLQQAPGQVHVRVWQELSPWIRDLVGRASLKWVERLGAGEPCHIVTQDPAPARRCTNAAIAHCIACRRATCLRHSFVDGSGEAICFACVSGVLHERGAPPPPHSNGAARKPREDELRAARKLLKVGVNASWDDVRAQYRKLSAKWHPDRVQGEAAKVKAEAKFKEIQNAYDVLKREYGQ